MEMETKVRSNEMEWRANKRKIAPLSYILCTVLYCTTFYSPWDAVMNEGTFGLYIFDDLYVNFDLGADGRLRNCV